MLLGGVGAGVTTAVWDELAVLEPTKFEAVTVTRMVEPTSSVPGVYV